MARRRTDFWDDLFEALRWLFSVIHPAWCIPLAACFFLLPGLWLQYNVPQMQMLGWLIGFVPAMVSLAAGVAGWKIRQQRAAFPQPRTPARRNGVFAKRQGGVQVGEAR